MALPPAWKVKRELRRAYEKARDAVSPRLLDHLRQRHHDRNLARLLRETPGGRPLTQRVAAFILFQPKGIAGSTFLTLDHLAQEGWSVLVISNAPLSDADRIRLAAASGHVIERPNTGYDFGAYREAWRWLHRHGHALDRLILMNDSTWFPLRMDDTSLRRMEALGADLAGHIFKTETAKDKGNDHLESHLLLLSKQAIAHPKISKFWADYVMTGQRTRTIQLGEKGLSQTALGANLSVQGLLSQERMVDLLDKLSNADLLDALENLALHSEVGKTKRTSLLAAAAKGQSWRQDFLSWAHGELSNSLQHLISVTFIDPAVRYGGMGFLKKSNDRRFQIARLALLRGISAGNIPPLDPIVDVEVQEATRLWTQPEAYKYNPAELAGSLKF